MEGRHHGEAALPDIVAILITVPSLDVLEARIRRRDPDVTDAYIAERME